MGKSLLRRLATIFLLPASVLLGAYLALPLWLPSFVRSQLAPEWQLESLEFDYPVSSVLHVDSITFRGNPGGTGIHITARDLDVNILQRSVDASAVDVVITLADPDGQTELFALDDLAVPVIFRPGKPPLISIDSLRLNLQSGGLAGRSLLFTGLQLERNEAAQSHLETRLSLPGMSDLTGRIEIRMLHDSLAAKLQLRAPDHSEVLHIDFRQWGEAQEIFSELVGQAQLQDLQPLLLATIPALGALQSMQGQVTFETYFTGSDKQFLDFAKLSAQNVILDLDSESLGLDVHLEARREEDWILIDFPDSGKLRFNDHENRISSLLDAQLPATQNRANSTAGVNDNLLIAIEPHSEIRLKTGAHPAAEFVGAVTAEFSSALLDLSLEAGPDAQFRIADLLNPRSLSGAGIVTVKLESRQALTFETTASPSLPRGASLQASGRLDFDGNTIRFTESTGFRAFIPRLTARLDAGTTATGSAATGLDFHGLEFAGALELSLPVTADEKAVEFHYSGSVKSNSARVSQSEPGKAPQTLIDTESIVLQLDFSQSGEQLHTVGTGTAHNVRMDSPAISVSQIDLQWNEVDPLAVTGEFHTQTRGLVFKHEEETYQGVDLDVAYSLLADGRIEGRGDVLFADGMRTPIRFRGTPDSGDWLINVLPLQLSLRQAVNALETTMGTIPGQIEFGDGTIDIEGKLSLGLAMQGNMNIHGRALDFSLGESTVEGADFFIDSKLNETLAGKGWLSIERIGLAAGLDLFQTRVSVGLMTPDILELDDLQAEFFGGRLSADHISLSAQGLGDTQIKMTDIDLGQVLEYIDVGGLTGSGKLTISLPAGSHGSSLYIRNGVFHANGPGILIYAESLSGIPVENIGLSALENFHYSELSGTIDYLADGSYQLLVHLAGSNPDLYDGYPIKLNLTIGGMLPEAFEVLFLTGDFDKAILNTIRQEKLD